MPLATRVNDLATRIGAEIKSLRTAVNNAPVAPVLDRPGGFQSPNVRRCAFQFGTGNNGTRTDYLAGFTRLPIRLPVGTTRWRLRMANKDNTGNTGSTFQMQSAWVSETFRNFDTGEPIPWSGTNVQALSASGAQSGEWVSPWVTAANAQFTNPGTMYSLSIEFTRASGTLYIGSGGSWMSTNRAQVSMGVPDNPGMSYVPWVPFSICVEYEFEGTNQTFAVIGDSISEGVGSTFNIYTWHQRASMRLGMPCVMSASSGAFAQASFGNSYGGGSVAEPRWSRIRDGQLNIDAAIVHLGTNETAWGGTLLGYQQGMVITHNRILSEWGVRKTYATTLAPRNVATTAGGEILRKQINDYLRSGKPFYRDTFDIAVEMESTPNGNNLRADYAGPNADYTHWGDIGQLRASRAINF